jgi:hypothetical protein
LFLVYAISPNPHALGHRAFQAGVVETALGPVADVVRTNGRFIWPFLWLVAMLSFAVIARQVRAAAACVVFAGAAFIQVVDLEHLALPRPVDTLDETSAILETFRDAGVDRVEVQPPWITQECTPAVWEDFDRLGEVIVSSAALGLPINAGYPSRGSDEYQNTICRSQALAFESGSFAPDVLYVVPEPPNSEMQCIELPREIYGCRLPS